MMHARKKITGFLLIWIALGVAGLVGVRNEALFVSREAAASKALSALTVRAETELGRFTHAIEAMLRIVAKWGMEGALDGAGIPDLCAKFLPVLDEYQRVSGLILATGLGKEFFLNRKGDQWALELSGIDPATVDLASAPGIASRIAEVRKSLPGYDPRSRPWFRKAAMGAAGDLKVAWTAPYRFFNERQDGITASLGWRDDEGVDHIVAADVLLKDYIDFIASLDPGPDAKIFLAKADGTLLFPPVTAGPFAGAAENLARNAKRDRPEFFQAGDFTFSFHDQPWRAQVRALEKQRGQLLLGVLMPEPAGTFRLRLGKILGSILMGAWLAGFVIFLWNLFHCRDAV